MFSKTCEYAIKASIYIASQSLENKRVGIKEIAQEIASPEAFTAKILQVLSKNHLVDSVKGPNGGFEIQPAKLPTTMLAQIVKAVDGDNIFISCGLGLKNCSAKNPCPLHNQFAKIRQDISRLLDNTSLADLANGLSSGLTFLTSSNTPEI
ncbi:RrF2 family transcriptional regulator [Flectobacillus major]|uniref:RrF2 family transcriptional regulator n=1 Tax=Flectobacillus major TaxID=103 RepID=UPI0004125708|nr:Rrf2 family transcriptional regulator [Flectobacillus major]